MPAVAAVWRAIVAVAVAAVVVDDDDIERTVIIRPAASRSQRGGYGLRPHSGPA
jgi:hypothetical protein